MLTAGFDPERIFFLDLLALPGSLDLSKSLDLGPRRPGLAQAGRGPAPAGPGCAQAGPGRAQVGKCALFDSVK